MTLRRVVALAQALTMSTLLLPGPVPVGPSAVRAAPAPAQPGPVVDVVDATGGGVGCLAGTSKYKGPGLPKEPPWPPGAAPTPTPEPTPSPSPDASPPADAAVSEEETARAATAFLAASGVRLAQAEPQAEPVAEPTPPQVKNVRKSKLLRGIDVSNHQGAVDYTVVREAGNRFVIAKATESTEFVDSWYATNLRNARDAGLAVGAYHVFDYTSDGVRQADHFIDRLEAVGGIDDSLPPVIDVECWSYRGRSVHTISAARLEDLVERVYRRTGRMPVIYTSVYMWSQVVGDAEGFGELPLWAACWRCDAPPSLAAGWEDWAFWQIGTFRIPGVTTDPGIGDRVDGNYFSGKGKDLDAMKLRPIAISGATAAMPGATVALDLGGRDAVALRAAPEGEDWGDWSRIRSAPRVQVPREEGTHSLRVQLRNGPGLRSAPFETELLVDGTAPEVGEPSVSLREGPLGARDGRVPVSVTWESRDEHAGLTDGAVHVACGADGSHRDEAPGSAGPGEALTQQASTSLYPGTCDITAVSIDGAGNRARAVLDGVRATVTTTGTDAEISGDEVGVIAVRGPDRGRASVSIDGQAIGLVDLYAPELTGPEVVYVARLDGGPARLDVEATGTSDPASAGTSVAIDGFVSLERDV